MFLALGVVLEKPEMAPALSLLCARYFVRHQGSSFQEANTVGGKSHNQHIARV